MDQAVGSWNTDKSDGRLARKVLIRLLITMLLVIGLMGLAGYLLREPAVGFSEGLVSSLGSPGIGFAFFVSDAFPLFPFHDAYLAIGMVGNLEFWLIAFWASLGSLTGGSLGYLIGRLFRRSEAFRQYTRQKGGDIYKLLNRYGVWALAIGALSPFPYSMACWITGMLRMRYFTFITISLLRIPRIVAYLCLIRLGVIQFFK
jgi:membrane protein YqaA with SNARE-associated domain